MLSKYDAICLLELIHKSLSCTTEDDLRELMSKLSCLIPYDPPKDFLSLAEDFGLKDCYTRGARNLRGTEGSLFCVSGKSLGHDKRTETILRLIVPHLQQVLVRIVDRHNAKKDVFLSSREKEVLNWIKNGKTTWDISIILDMSERTVKFHVKNIMQKLDAVSRPHAVAIALGRGLIDIE